MVESKGIKEVRKRLEHSEDIAPMDGLSPPTDDDAPPRTPDDPPPLDEVPYDPIMAACEQPMNDYGNGQRFILHFGEDVMFVPRVGWFSWDGIVWRKDQDELAVRAKAQKIWALIEQEIRYIKPTKREEKYLAEDHGLKDKLKKLEDTPAAERSESHDDDLGSIIARRKALDGMLKDRKSLIRSRLNHAKNAGNNGPIGHMMTESTTDLAVAFEELDKNPLDINTLSGLLRFHVVNLREEGAGLNAECKLLDHSRDHKLTKIMPVMYDPDAKAELFDAFLARIQPQREMREFLQRWFGLSMSGLKSQRLAFFFGNGANGKSVLNDLMGRIMAGYAASLKIESLTGTNRRSGAEATPDLIPLLGARFVRTSEPDQGEKLQEGLIKQLTGGEPIPVRPNYGDQIDMDPIFKLTISGNYKPEIRGTDDGIWRRVMLVPFDINIPESEQDREIGEKLWAERDGIFTWMVDGLIDYLEGGLRPPDIVLDATSEYRADSDPIGTFLTTCCTITGNHKDSIRSKDLGDAFNYYLLDAGHSTWKPTTFAKQVATKSRQWKHPETGKQFAKGKSSLSQYTGLQLTAPFKKRFDAAPKDQHGRAVGVAPEEDTGTPDPYVDAFRE